MPPSNLCMVVMLTLLLRTNKNNLPLPKMPIVVHDYTWRETEREMLIKVPLKGVKSSKADIFSTNRYIKVNFPPYLFEVHLFKTVLELNCTAKVGNGAVEFILEKEEKEIWGRLASDESGDKAAMTDKRTEAIEHAQKKSAKEAEKKAKKAREEQTFAIKQEMKLEEEEREHIEFVKKEERERTERELDEWKHKQKQNKVKKKIKSKNINTCNNVGEIWKEKKSAAMKPPPRKNGSIQVRFTPRAFPTAARESQELEEQEWLTKMAAARKIKTASDLEESINDRNPEFLKDKGVNLFQRGNYEGAINAFSEAIKLNPHLPQLFSNRAACSLALGENEKCIMDCCRALELYYPVVPSNYTQRTKVFVRRGTAYANCGQLDLASQDYSAALILCPQDEDLKEDYAKIKIAMKD